MKIQQTVEKAIEGGWTPEKRGELDNEGFAKLIRARWGNGFLLDPSFWQSLGKALGWEKYCCKDCGSSKAYSYALGESGEYGASCNGCGKELMEEGETDQDDLYILNNEEELDESGKMYKQGNMDTSVYHQHLFVDHLAEGKTIESYFETL